MLNNQTFSEAVMVNIEQENKGKLARRYGPEFASTDLKNQLPTFSRTR